jgi:hypothetical protein
MTTSIITKVPVGDLIGSTQDVVLFKGEITKPESIKSPSIACPDRRTRVLRCVGQAARLSDAMFWCQQSFAQAPADLDPVGAQANKPWRITDMIKWGLGQAGVTADGMDVPDLEVRYYPSARGSVQDMILQPGVKILPWVENLVKLINHNLMFDANRLPHGRWRVTSPALQSTSPLWQFTLDHPGAGKTYGSGAYAADTCHIHRDTFRCWLEAPELNKLIVTTTGSLTPGGDSDQGLVVKAVNPASYNYKWPDVTADLSSPDYLRKEVAAIVYDPALGAAGDSRQAWNQLVEYTMNLAALTFHAKLWCSFVAPFYPVTDPTYGHWRPALPYDCVTIGGYPAWVRSCDIEIGHDDFQDAHYTALFDLGNMPL